MNAECIETRNHFQRIKNLVAQPSSQVEFSTLLMHAVIRHYPQGQLQFEVKHCDKTSHRPNWVMFKAQTDLEGRFLSPGVEIEKDPDFKLVASQAMSKVLFETKILGPIFKALFQL